MTFELVKKYQVHIAVSIAFISGIFSYTTFQFPLSAWIWPAALLFAVRSVTVRKGILISIAVIMTSTYLGYIVPLNGASSMSTIYLIAMIRAIFLTSIVTAIPFVVDRVFYGKIGTVRQLFVFPLTLATVSFFIWMLPVGSAYSFIYSQSKFLCFTQGLSIYGMLGMIFLLGWFATSVNLFIRTIPTRDKEIKWTAICAIAIVAVMVFGGIRLATADDPKTANVLFAEGPYCVVKLPLEEQISIFDQVFNTAIKNNAEMIVFYEVSFYLEEGQISSFEEHAAKRVKASGIYLVFASVIEEKGNKHNTCTLVTPENGVEWRYNKANLAMSLEVGFTPGNGLVYSTDTPIGKIASVICMDLYFHNFVNSVDKDTDILVAPAFDPKGLEGWNARNHSFRAIENGVSLVKATMNGTSATYDQYGRLVDMYTSFDHTPGNTHMVRASIGGCHTFYGEYGYAIDLMFVICTVLLLLSCIYTCRYSREKDQ